MEYELYFRRPDDCVVYSADPETREVSLVHRQRDGIWHCALCRSTGCRHVHVAARATGEVGLADEPVA